MSGVCSYWLGVVVVFDLCLVGSLLFFACCSCGVLLMGVAGVWYCSLVPVVAGVVDNCRCFVVC